MYFNFTLLGFSRVVTSKEMGVLTCFLTVAFFRSRIHTNFIFTSVLMTVLTSSLPVCYARHGEPVGSIRMHLVLPVCRPFQCLALGNGLFSTLLLYQRIVNLMAAVEGIGCHQVIYIWNIKKKKKKKSQGWIMMY